ncbi:MAG: DUF86 domain-containing protein [bacterium]|nr:DUF86 domain-containing protein [bacterium]
MSKRSDKLLLEDIIDSINEIQNFTTGLSFEQFSDDIKTMNAVLWSLSTIGEAANKLSTELSQKYNEIDWHHIISFRNRIIHEYFGVDYSLVWDVIKTQLEKLKLYAEMILNTTELD